MLAPARAGAARRCWPWRLVESAWLISIEPMSGRLPAGSGRAVPPSWPTELAASGSAPLRAGLVMLLRSGTMPLALSSPPPVSGSIAAKIGAGGHVLAVARGCCRPRRCRRRCGRWRTRSCRRCRGRGPCRRHRSHDVAGDDAVGDVETRRPADMDAAAEGIVGGPLGSSIRAILPVIVRIAHDKLRVARSRIRRHRWGCRSLRAARYCWQSCCRSQRAGCWKRRRCATEVGDVVGEGAAGDGSPSCR